MFAPCLLARTDPAIRGLLDGLRFAWRDPCLRAMTAFSSLGNLARTGVDALLVVSAAAIGPEPGEQAPGSAQRCKRATEVAATLDPRTAPCPEGAAAVPEPVARITPTGRGGPYLNAGTRPFKAPARRQLDAPGPDIVGYPGQPSH
jgi:hypothetical protein